MKYKIHRLKCARARPRVPMRASSVGTRDNNSLNHSSGRALAHARLPAAGCWRLAKGMPDSRAGIRGRARGARAHTHQTPAARHLAPLGARAHANPRAPQGRGQTEVAIFLQQCSKLVSSAHLRLLAAPAGQRSLICWSVAVDACGRPKSNKRERERERRLRVGARPPARQPVRPPPSPTPAIHKVATRGPQDADGAR